MSGYGTGLTEVRPVFYVGYRKCKCAKIRQISDYFRTIQERYDILISGVFTTFQGF